MSMLKEVAELEALFEESVACEADHLIKNVDTGAVRPMPTPCSHEAAYRYSTCAHPAKLVCIAFAVDLTNRNRTYANCARCLQPVEECRVVTPL